MTELSCWWCRVYRWSLVVRQRVVILLLLCCSWERNDRDVGTWIDVERRVVGGPPSKKILSSYNWLSPPQSLESFSSFSWIDKCTGCLIRHDRRQCGGVFSRPRSAKWIDSDKTYTPRVRVTRRDHLISWEDKLRVLIRSVQSGSGIIFKDSRLRHKKSQVHLMSRIPCA